MNKKDIGAFIEEHRAAFIEASDKIWDLAETAFEEYGSVKVLTEALEKFGFAVEQKVGGIETAFCGTWGSGGPVVGILGEYDALSGMSQKSGVAVKEKDPGMENGHGCGHNMFGAGALAAAVAAKEYLEKNKLPGTIKYFGCPGEEGGSGKAFMARAGVFKGLDVAFGWHPAAINSVTHTSSLANYQVLYKFKGLSAHAAAAPHLGRSALDAVELMNNGVNYLREHIVQEARVHYAITNTGGFSPNVVQAEANVLYLIRAPRLEQVEEIYQRVNKIAQGAAMMTETTVEIDFVKACANIITNEVLAKVLDDNFKAFDLPAYDQADRELARKIADSITHKGSDLSTFTNLSGKPLRKYLAELENKTLCDIVIPLDLNQPGKVLPGSSDVGDVSWNVPTSQIATACYALGTPGHSWQLVAQGKSGIAHKGMLLAGKVMAGAAVDVIENPDLIARAKEDFQEQLDGSVYKSPIPAEVQPRAIGKL